MSSKWWQKARQPKHLTWSITFSLGSWVCTRPNRYSIPSSLCLNRPRRLTYWAKTWTQTRGPASWVVAQGETWSILKLKHQENKKTIHPSNRQNKKTWSLYKCRKPKRHLNGKPPLPLDFSSRTVKNGWLRNPKLLSWMSSDSSMTENEGSLSWPTIKP